jgi:predicted RecB family nuclease
MRRSQVRREEAVRLRVTNDGTISFSPTDLTVFAACRHASVLDVLMAEGRPRARPERSPDADVLAELGRRHEQAYVASLREAGKSVIEIGGPADDEAKVRTTLEAMATGVDVVVQAPLRSRSKGGSWRGIADVLKRVEAPSRLGVWSYEPVDTKLSKTTKAGAIVQLTLYALWLEEAQGALPEHLTVVSPGEPFVTQRYRVDDAAAYVRRLRGHFEEFVAGARADRAQTVAEPVDHCQVCSWWRHCDQTWREEDRLVLVANLGRAHRYELERRGVGTVAELASREQELGFRPDHGSGATYLAAAHQARLQLATRETGAVAHELLRVEPDRGIERLPAPSRFDLFFDLEGDPFFGTGGLEYLWGWSNAEGDYRHRWALDKRAEREAFGEFMELLLDRWRKHPDMHVYHYGPYEPNALKRLMSIHGSFVEELDTMLRAELFVDLLTVTRQAARIGVERYSLKDMERLHGYVRDADLRGVGPHKRALEHGLMLGEVEAVPEESLEVVRVYNRDDVRSTLALRDWLEERRSELVEMGLEPARLGQGDGAPSEDLLEKRTAAMETVDALRPGLPDDMATWTDEERARALLANLIDFERREDKAVFWEKFALQAMEPEALEANSKGVTGLEFVAELPGGTPSRPVHRYRFPAQEIDVRSGDSLYAAVDGEWVMVGDGLVVDPARLTLDVLKVGKWSHVHPREAILWNRVPSDVVAEARLAFAQDVLDRGVDAHGQFRAARDLLLRKAGRGLADPPRAWRKPDESALDAAVRMAGGLSGGVLPVQGPPGAGKSYTGAHVILDFVKRGKRVGVTASSNKVVANLLAGIARQAREVGGAPVRIFQRATKEADVADGATNVTNYHRLRRLIDSGDAQVVGGTAWLWSRPEFREAVDLLVIDEAGQLSLAMALSVATAAWNVLLLGDPQQLEQPLKATHPDGADVAVLRHMMGEHKTVQDGEGLFLERTFRLAPNIARFTSELAYERRLEAIDRNAAIALLGTDGFDGTGLRFRPVEHEGRSGAAPEEVDAVAAVIGRLLVPGARFRDNAGIERPLAPADVLVVAPFNRHVEALARKVPDGVRVGTVDRFQGQEAPVVIYAMGVSSSDLAPRGLGFLFSTERFNVATSRAQALVVLVASELLFDTMCRTPEEIRLVNGHVRFLELATPA